MQRYFIDLAYLGSAYHGWQVQPGAVTVQEVLEKALSTLVHSPVGIIGAGRTDAGVNARRMIAHADLPDGVDPTGEGFLRSLNSICGRDIAVYSFTPVASDAHARFDADEREYRYFAHTVRWPFSGGLSWWLPRGLDFDAMNEAGELLLGRRDFTSFSKVHTDVKTNICDLRLARWSELEDRPGFWQFEIRADRFLRNMVRAVVGTLSEVGRHKIPPAVVLEVLEARNRCAAGTSVPGEPLFLWNIHYPCYTPPERK